jgi:hypothetical protein
VTLTQQQYDSWPVLTEYRSLPCLCWVNDDLDIFGQFCVEGQRIIAALDADQASTIEAAMAHFKVTREQVVEPKGRPPLARQKAKPRVWLTRHAPVEIAIPTAATMGLLDHATLIEATDRDQQIATRILNTKHHDLDSDWCGTVGRYALRTYLGLPHDFAWQRGPDKNKVAHDEVFIGQTLRIRCRREKTYGFAVPIDHETDRPIMQADIGVVVCADIPQHGPLAWLVGIISKTRFLDGFERLELARKDHRGRPLRDAVLDQPKLFSVEMLLEMAGFQPAVTPCPWEAIDPEQMRAERERVLDSGSVDDWRRYMRTYNPMIDIERCGHVRAANALALLREYCAILRERRY